VATQTAHYTLRHYRPTGIAPAASGATFLLVPPLMVTAEIYDMAPDLSLVLWLCEQGHDVWLVDFGPPGPPPDRGARAAGSAEVALEKDLADHILSVSHAVDEVGEQTGKSVHLLGYSQGGMFVYQAAAFRGCQGIASLITLGSPVDFVRNLPVPLHRGVFSNVMQAGVDFVRGVTAHLPPVPARASSLAFKLASPRQELKHFLEILRLLDDEEALKRIEPARRFLGGEGFIAWPGPALRGFVEEFIVHNRLMTGGLVVAGRTLSLADLRVPVLYFVGRRDQFARPDSVRAIEKLLPHDHHLGFTVDTGHLGLIVGGRAREEVWPRLHAWVQVQEQRLPASPLLQPEPRRQPSPRPTAADSATLGPIVHAGTRTLLRESSRVALSLSGAARWSRFQLPHLLSFLRFWDGAALSIGRLLAEQARALPQQTFLLWEGRAYSYAEANARVTQIAAALYACGVRPQVPVGLLMDNHPDCLTALAALSRLGAVAVVLNPAAHGLAFAQAIAVTGIRALILGPPSHTRADTVGLKRLRIGSTSPAPPASPPLSSPRPDPAESTADEVHLDRIAAEWPAGLAQDAGRAADLACLLFTSGTTGQPKAARISNRRFVMAATAASAGCALTPADTVYCSLPLHHGTGLFLAAGGALVAGSRLAIAPRFSTSRFWQDVRRVGATVVFYVGELCRYLVTAPPSPLEKGHAVRLFVGNGLRADVWRELLQRFGQVSVLEFYGSTEGNALMVNLTGEKIGSIGRVPFGLVRTLLAEYDPVNKTYARDEEGFVRPVELGRPGMLLVEIRAGNPLSAFDGYTDAQATSEKILRDVRRRGDAWFVSGDLLREDADGDFWFVDRVGDTFRWKGENVSTEQVESVLNQLPFVALSAVYGVRLPGQEGRAGMAAIVLRPEVGFDPQALYAACEQHLSQPACPRFVRLVDELPSTDTLKVKKQVLQDEGIDPARTGPLYRRDARARTYVRVEPTQANDPSEL
jgi:putative long chain acyl-CoA synthase